MNQYCFVLEPVPKSAVVDLVIEAEIGFDWVEKLCLLEGQNFGVIDQFPINRYPGKVEKTKDRLIVDDIVEIITILVYR